MIKDIKDKVFFISGSTSGIGLGLAKKLVTNGAKVIIIGRSIEKINLIKQNDLFNNKNSLILKKDLTNKKNCEFSIDKSIKKFKKIDCLILNLGSGKKDKDLYDEDNTAINKMYEINFWPSYNLINSSLPHLIKSKGNVISISTICATSIIDNAPLGYSLSKAALLKMIKIFARRYSKYSIRFNSIVPGNIMFPGSTWDLKKIDNPRAIKKYIKTNVPLNRFGSINNIFNAVIYLSNAHSEFITGTEIIIDGGQTI